MSWRGSACAAETASEENATRNRARTKYFIDSSCPKSRAGSHKRVAEKGLYSSVTWMHAERRLVVRRWRADPSSAAALDGGMEEDLHPDLSVAKSKRKRSE